MNDYEIRIMMSEISRNIVEVRKALDQHLLIVKPEDELWDNSDMVRYWHVSERTLATWRARKVIGFIQVGNKIWYTKKARGEFLRRNLVRSNHYKIREDGLHDSVIYRKKRRIGS